jgi:hypothetical protein
MQVDWFDFPCGCKKVNNQNYLCRIMRLYYNKLLPTLCRTTRKICYKELQCLVFICPFPVNVGDSEYESGSTCWLSELVACGNKFVPVVPQLEVHSLSPFVTLHQNEAMLCFLRGQSLPFEFSPSTSYAAAMSVHWTTQHHSAERPPKLCLIK